MYSKLLITLLIVVTLNCVNRDPRLEVFGTKTFWASKFRNGVVSPVQVPAVFLGSSDHAMVYGELSDLVEQDVAANMLAEFEANIVNKEHSLFGTPLDINDDGKVSILLLDIDDGTSSASPSITGYYDPFNQFKDSKVFEATCDNSATENCSRSNELEMLYIDSQLAKKADKKSLYATLAHEYQHVLHFAHDYNLNPSNVQVEATWVNEGISEVIADITGYGPQSNRLTTFSNARGNSLISWNNASPLTDYAHTYAYFRFLTDVYGESFLSKAFSANGLNIPGINAALASLNDADLLADCGNDNKDSNYPYFDCTYRFMWASLYNMGTDVDGHRGMASVDTTFFEPSAKFNFSAANKPTAPTASTAPPGTGTISLAPYSAGVFTKGNDVDANLSSCTGCSITNFTLFFKAASPGDEQYVVYNHDSSLIGVNSSIDIVPNVVESHDHSDDDEVCGNIPVTQDVMIQLSN